ncbi:galactose mutarotase [Sphingomonas japonica]|nr:aldose epimerase family protein [Sphingomonas japonica]
MVVVRSRSIALPNGTDAQLFTLGAGTGLTVTLSDLGATLIAISAPDRDGGVDNVLLGSHDLADYPVAGSARSHHYLGATCGRFANRIAGARFVLDGHEYRVAANDPPHHLHGGVVGFDALRWNAQLVTDGVTMQLESADGDQGFPGTLTVQATFRIIDGDTLEIAYEATSDRPTHVNLTSHGYFNLAGRDSITAADHLLTIAADRYLPIAPDAIPLGTLEPVVGTPFDFRTPRAIGERIDADHPQIEAGDGYNHCFALDTPRLDRTSAVLSHRGSGRRMAIATSVPGLQLYSGNALPDDGLARGRRSGVAIEAQHFPDTPNRPGFPATRLDPGETWRSVTRLTFSADG